MEKLKNNIVSILIITLSYVSLFIITQLYWAHHHNYDDIVLRIFLAAAFGIVFAIIIIMGINFFIKKYFTKYNIDINQLFKKISVSHLSLFLLWLYPFHISKGNVAFNNYLPLIVLGVFGAIILNYFLKNRLDYLNKRGSSVYAYLSSNSDKIKKLFYVLLVLFILGLGVYFRIDGYFTTANTFAVDESQIARYLSWDGGLSKTLMKFGASRPLGYLIVNKIIVEIFNTEATLRLTSLIPSILSLFLAFYISRKLFKSKWLIILVLAFFSFNPYLISFAKDFKHYSFDFFAHMTIIHLFLLYLENKNKKNLLLLCIASFIAIFFSINIIFTFPGIFIFLIYKLIKEKEPKQISMILITCSSIIVTLVLLYFFIWSQTMDRFIVAWGNRFSGFREIGEPKYIPWIMDRISNIFTYFINYPTDQQSVLNNTMLFFSLAGVIVLLKDSIKAPKYAVVFIAPIIIMIVFNYFEYWPLSNDRTNLFVIIYLGFLFTYGLSLLFTKRWDNLRLIGISLIFFLLVFFLPESTDYYNIRHTEYDTPYEDARAPLDYLYERGASEKAELFLNPHAWIAFEYYVYYHDILSEKYKPFFEDNFNIHVYESRENEYVMNYTEQIFTEYTDNVYFFLFHYQKESNVLYQTLSEQSIYSEIKFERSSIINAASKNNCIFPEIYPDSMYEAEDGVMLLSNNESMLADIPETSGLYIISSNIFFNLSIEQEGTYTIQARALAKDGHSDSWFIQLGDYEKYRWNVPHSQDWQWNTIPMQWHLAPGNYLLSFEAREPTPLDSFSVIRVE